MEDQSVLEKKREIEREREREKAEVSDDLKFSTTMGVLSCIIVMLHV